MPSVLHRLHQKRLALTQNHLLLYVTSIWLRFCSLRSFFQPSPPFGVLRTTHREPHLTTTLRDNSQIGLLVNMMKLMAGASNYAPLVTMLNVYL